jgi:hypothetical protein
MHLIFVCENSDLIDVVEAVPTQKHWDWEGTIISRILKRYGAWNALQRKVPESEVTEFLKPPKLTVPKDGKESYMEVVIL